MTYEKRCTDNPEIKKVFDLTVEQCKRASTKERGLNSDLVKDELLVKALRKNTTTYGSNIVAQFQVAYEAKNPALSFLFAQISNLILEKTFHVGSCQLQADVALFEFCKKGIFNASLICSNPIDELTQHWYSMILDDHTFKNSSRWPNVYTAVEANGFNKNSLYFDTWSNQYCEWKDFIPDPKNTYLKNLKKLKQVMFKPLIHLFKDEVDLLENIIWCLTEYEKRLKNLALSIESIPTKYTKLFTYPEDAFQTEVKFLFDSRQCVSQLLANIEMEKQAFQARLDTVKETHKDSAKEKDEKLFNPASTTKAMDQKSNSSSSQASDERTSAFLAGINQIMLKAAAPNAPFIIAGGKEMLFYNVAAEDRVLWNELIDYGDDVSIQKAIKAGKSYLLTHVIGNPADPHAQLLRHNEAHYGNIYLHNRMVQSHDETIISSKNLDTESTRLLSQNRKGADYLLRYYELKQKNAISATTPEGSTQKRADIRKAITAKDIEGKTPLLLTCKHVNQQYALRLINLDEQKETINVADTVEGHTPLHIACILGLKELATKLIELGADKQATDKLGHTPFYYLACSVEEKTTAIKNVLDSVNFFYGRYFNASDSTWVTEALIKRNNALKQNFADLIHTQETLETTHRIQQFTS